MSGLTTFPPTTVLIVKVFRASGVAEQVKLLLVTLAFPIRLSTEYLERQQMRAQMFGHLPPCGR